MNLFIASRPTAQPDVPSTGMSIVNHVPPWIWRRGVHGENMPLLKTFQDPWIKP